jgi:DNA repair exonuclease SbcCD ATPase subunit
MKILQEKINNLQRALEEKQQIQNKSQETIARLKTLQDEITRLEDNKAKLDGDIKRLAKLKIENNEQALALVKTATTRGLYIADALKRLAPLRDALPLLKSSGASTETVAKMQKNLDSLLEDIEKTLREYAQCLDQLYKFEKDSREQAFTQYLGELTSTGGVEQIKVLNRAIKKHLEQYPKRPEGNFAQWKSDFAKF